MTCVCRRVRVLTDAPVHFGQIPPEHWYQPEWIDEAQATANRLRMMAQGIIYAGKWTFQGMRSRFTRITTATTGSVP